MFFHRGGKRNKFGWFTLEVFAKHCGIAQSLVGGFPRGLMRQPPPAAFYKAGREPQVLPGSLALQLEITFRARGFCICYRSQSLEMLPGLPSKRPETHFTDAGYPYVCALLRWPPSQTSPGSGREDAGRAVCCGDRFSGQSCRPVDYPEGCIIIFFLAGSRGRV